MLEDKMDYSILEWIKALGPLIPAFMLVYIGYRQWKTDDDKRRYLLFDRYIRNFQKINDAIALTIKDGDVKNEAESLFWQARDEARLILDEEIANFTQELFDLAHEGYLIYRNRGNLNDKEREQKSHEWSNIFKKISETKPYEIYKKYLKPLQ